MAIEVDRISKLHDDLLLHILSFLPYTNYRARTSIISKRWRHLWSYHPDIRIAMTPSNVPPSDSCAKQLRAIDGCFGHLNTATLRTLDISVRSPSFIRSLCEERSTTVSDKWFCLAALRSVRILRLSLNSYPDRDLAKPVFSCRTITELRLIGPWNIKSLPLSFRGFPFLRELGLHGCHFADGILESLVSRCPVLERLAYTSRLSSRSELVVSSKTLRHVVICTTASRPLIRLTVEAPSLLSIRLSGSLLSLFLKNTPSLCRVDVRGLYVTKAWQPDGGWSSVEKLQADHGFFHQYLLQKSSSFSNLKELRYANEWITDPQLHALMSILGNCPTLENLQVDLNGAERAIAVKGIIAESKVKKAMLSELAEEYCKGSPVEEQLDVDYANFRYSPHRLKVVRINGILGTGNEMRLVEYVLEKGEEAMEASIGINILRGTTYRFRFFLLYPFKLVLRSHAQ